MARWCFGLRPEDGAGESRVAVAPAEESCEACGIWAGRSGRWEHGAVGWFMSRRAVNRNRIDIFHAVGNELRRITHRRSSWVDIGLRPERTRIFLGVGATEIVLLQSIPGSVGPRATDMLLLRSSSEGCRRFAPAEHFGSGRSGFAVPVEHAGARKRPRSGETEAGGWLVPIPGGGRGSEFSGGGATGRGVRVRRGGRRRALGLPRP